MQLREHRPHRAVLNIQPVRVRCSCCCNPQPFSARLWGYGYHVIASVAKQSPAWNKYSNCYFLSAEIATGINALAMTLCCATPSLRGGQSPTKQSPAWNKYSNYYFLSAEIATGINALAMTGNSCGLLVIASEQRERGNPSHEKATATFPAPCPRLGCSFHSLAMTVFEM